MLYLLSYRDMKAALFYFIFNVAALVDAHVSKDLAEHPFQCVVSYGTARVPVWVANRRVTVVAQVECRAVKVAGVDRSIIVASPQLVDIIASPQHTRYYHLV